jgi:hypothetical protein
MRRCLPLLLGFFLFAPSLHADNSFDLVGPKVDVHVKRGDLTLPISRVPNLLPGDRLWIHPDLPESQTNHFVLVVAFLRGATNLPPNDWFTRVETWTKDVRTEGVFVTVPAEAEQALIFLAPETGGDFSTLRKAVHDRPGVFVRAAQDLQAASADRVRLDTYLADVKETSQTDEKALKERAQLSARSLGIRLDNQCFDRPTDQQAPCLVSHSDGLVLDDANTQGMVTQLANGSAGDMMNQISYSQAGGYGMYSAYLGAIIDMARILSSLHTAHFQYIPALALPDKDTLNLRLNVPPSFRDPKSVVVVALPPIGPVKFPPLRPSNPTDVPCAEKPELVLAAEGAPLVFAAGIAHDLKLHIAVPNSAGGPQEKNSSAAKDGNAKDDRNEVGGIDIPVEADSAKGGLVPTGPLPKLPPGELTAVLRGQWGFDDWEGPHFHLVSSSPGKWSVQAADRSALVVGRADTLHIQGEGAQCVAGISFVSNPVVPNPAVPNSEAPKPLGFKAPSPGLSNSGLLEVSVPLEEAAPGSIQLEIRQYGAEKPDTLTLNTYAEAASLDRLTLSAGDRLAILKGKRLDEVAKITLEGVAFTPAALTRVEDFDQLAAHAEGDTSRLVAAPVGAAKPLTAKVQLRDGREVKVPVTIEPPRPQVSLLNKGTQEDGAAAPVPVRFGSADDLPLQAKLVFFLKSEFPRSFPRKESVEVAAVDGSFHATLSIADGTLMLEDARTALGAIEPLDKFGPSAFGPVHARAVSPDGVPGDWIPLGTLVRIPEFKELRCPRAQTRPCTLTANNLFLVEAVGSSPEMGNAIEIPADFTGAQIMVPHPVNGSLYLRLRDDPETVQTLNLPVTPIQAPPVATPASVQVPSSAQTAPPVPPATTAPVQPQTTAPQQDSAPETASPSTPKPQE